MIPRMFLYWGPVLGFVQCQHCGLVLGRQIHACIVRVSVMFNILVPTTLIHCYASNKDVVSGRKVFDEMPMRNSVTWNEMITGAGHLNEAYKFIMRMPVKADAILWRSLLSACNVHGNVVMGEKVGKILLQLQPESISDDLTGTSEDYVALSNVYTSAGRWQEVESLRKEMKIKKIETEPGCSLDIESSKLFQNLIVNILRGDIRI
ncbi:hypothetical protein Dsin_028238 [Dipteronia sinensis]|uniref:Pentatricopeptide repeat-containing protein n=1 Tax=Dipteronia sinensis TaxID=43782 RepID=A0AAD9ZRC7_9ROSI|nr:hypothetical protein Dsin_028238 [Dipteronia sinensis]